MVVIEDENGGLVTHSVPKRPEATNSIPEVSYSHPLTDEDKAKVDKFIDSIKRKAKK